MIQLLCSFCLISFGIIVVSLFVWNPSKSLLKLHSDDHLVEMNKEL